jgi:hypothetical protein
LAGLPHLIGPMPDVWIIAKCPLCSEKRRYLSSEIFRGRPSYNLYSKLGRGARL